MIAPININWEMDAPVLTDVLATSSTAPGMNSERISAFNILIMTTIHNVESRTFVSIFSAVFLIEFIFITPFFE
jgi:hypothetical protein